MLALVLCIVTLSVTNLCLANQGNQADISEELNYLKTKVDTLDTKLDILLERSGGKANDSSSQPGDEQSDDAAISRPVQLISAQRIPLDGGERNRFTIRLRNTTDGAITVRIYGNGVERGPDDIVAEGDGIYAFSVSVNADSDYYHLQIMDMNFSHYFTLLLRNTRSSAIIQNLENEHIPIISLLPEKEVVYTPGQTVTLTATVRFTEGSEDDIPSIDPIFTGVNMSSVDNQFLWSEYGLFDTYVHPRTPGKIKNSYTLTTETRPLGGYIIFGSMNTTIENTVVTTLLVMRSVTIRPSDQTGSFPPGYLHIIRERHHERSSRGYELRTCRPDEECWIDCYAMGENVTDMLVMRALANGDFSLVPSARSPPQVLSTMQSIHWKVEAEDEEPVVDDNAIFMCSAHDTNTGAIATKLIEVQLTKVPSIDIERSSVQVEVDPMNSDLRKITLNCAIVGLPLPDVYFYAARDVTSTAQAEAPDHMNLSSPYEGVAQKIYTMSAQELSEVRQAISSRNATAFSCQFLTYEGSDDAVAFYTFHLPDTPL